MAKIEIITGWDATLADWVGKNLGVDLGPGCVAVGFADGGELLGAIAYHNFQWPNIEGSIWSTSPRWCNRRTLFACFFHPFLAMKCRRFGANAAVTNQPSRAFLQRLGFQHEGTARQAVCHEGEVCDAAIYGMLAHECRWLGRLKPEIPAPTDQ